MRHPRIKNVKARKILLDFATAFDDASSDDNEVLEQFWNTLGNYLEVPTVVLTERYSVPCMARPFPQRNVIVRIDKSDGDTDFEIHDWDDLKNEAARPLHADEG